MELREKDIKRKMFFSFLLLFISVFFFVSGVMQITSYKVLPKESAVLLSGIRTACPKESYDYDLFVKYHKNKDITVKTNLKNSKQIAEEIGKIVKNQAEKNSINFKSIIIINRENQNIFILKGQ